MDDNDDPREILGRTVADRTSGFRGTATALSIRLLGGTLVEITAPIGEDGSFRAEWFDHARVVYL